MMAHRLEITQLMTPLKFVWKSKRSTHVLPQDARTRWLCRCQSSHATLVILLKTILHSCPTHFQFENLKYNVIWRPQRHILGEKPLGNISGALKGKPGLSPCSWLTCTSVSVHTHQVSAARAVPDFVCAHHRLSVQHVPWHLTMSNGNSVNRHCSRERLSQLFYLDRPTAQDTPRMSQQQGTAIHTSPPAGYQGFLITPFLWPFTKFENNVPHKFWITEDGNHHERELLPLTPNVPAVNSASAVLNEM